jgi:hypothetical protein
LVATDELRRLSTDLRIDAALLHLP